MSSSRGKQAIFTCENITFVSAEVVRTDKKSKAVYSYILTMTTISLLESLTYF